jgi:hypothetical protein
MHCHLKCIICILVVTTALIYWWNDYRPRSLLLGSDADDIVRCIRAAEDVTIFQGTKQYAYVNLCANEEAIFPSLLLFYQLQESGSKAGDFVMMVPEEMKSRLMIQWQNVLEDLNIRIFWLSQTLIYEDDKFTESVLFPIQFSNSSSFYQRGRSGVLRERDERIWNKLRVWLLACYKKIVLLDNDVLIVRNLDEAFSFPDLSGVPMTDTDEKIAFFEPSERQEDYVDEDLPVALFLNLKRLGEKYIDWTGLNTGFLVLAPSIPRLCRMIAILKAMQQRPCCPSQEFIWHYHEHLGTYHRLAQIWNLRRLEAINPDRRTRYLQDVRLFHFVGRVKPYQIFRGQQQPTIKVAKYAENGAIFIQTDDFVQAWCRMAQKFSDLYVN